MTADKISILSLQLPAIGNITYGNLLRKNFTLSDIKFRSFWANDDRSLRIRASNFGARLKLPLSWIRDRDLDLFRARADSAHSWLANNLISRERKKQNVDVLHFHTQNMALFAQEHMKQIPTVITTDQTAMQYAEDLAPKWRWTYSPIAKREKLSFHLARKILTFSEWAADGIVNEHNVPREKIHVVPVGVEVDLFAAIGLDREIDGPDLVNILFVGGDFRRKGGALLVEAFKKIAGGRNVRLHIISDSAPEVHHPKIKVYSKISAFTPEWYKVYANAHIFVLPTNNDASPIALLEAMAAGIPIISTSISSIPEMIKSDNGILINRGDLDALCDALTKLVTDKALRQSMAKANRLRAREHYDVRNHISKLHDIFVEAASDG